MKLARAELVPILDKLSTKLSARAFAAQTADYLLTEIRTGELDSLIRDLLDFRAGRGIVEVTA
ncbi:MAG TPA: hypothetical protein VFK97_02550, partial [Candidatus Saccharimonadales bacterium]|nr:hypothetical protein [Candidatus Saccharimonadales bacterium]